MFSGIIASVGQITVLTPRNDGSPTVRLTIEAGGLGLDDVELGDSIACNGVCLTVVERSGNTFSVDVSPETLSCTVGLSAPGAINLEKALRLADRLGGHLVSGHVDGVGTVIRFDPVGDNRLLEISAPEELAKYIARKGSITVNGVSLTTNAVEGSPLHDQPDPAHAGGDDARRNRRRQPGESGNRPHRPLRRAHVEPGNGRRTKHLTHRSFRRSVRLARRSAL